MTLAADVADLERARIRETLIACAGIRRDAAKRLGLPERSLHRKIAALIGAEELRALAVAHAWPPRTERATAARRKALTP